MIASPDLISIRETHRQLLMEKLFGVRFELQVYRSSSTTAEQIVQADIKTIATIPAPNHTLRLLAALYRFRSPSNSSKSR
jgi:hypothetical protein